MFSTKNRGALDSALHGSIRIFASTGSAAHRAKMTHTATGRLAWRSRLRAERVWRLGEWTGAGAVGGAQDVSRGRDRRRAARHDRQIACGAGRHDGDTERRRSTSAMVPSWCPRSACGCRASHETHRLRQAGWDSVGSGRRTTLAARERRARPFRPLALLNWLDRDASGAHRRRRGGSSRRADTRYGAGAGEDRQRQHDQPTAIPHHVPTTTTAPISKTTRH